MHTQKWCGYQSEIQQHSGVHISCSWEAIFPTSEAERSCRWNSTFHPSLGFGGLEEGQWMPRFCSRGWMSPPAGQFIIAGDDLFMKIFESRAVLALEKAWCITFVSTTILLMGSDSPWSLSAISAHAPMMLHFRNPATCGTYKQESFMGCMSTFCSHGARAARLSEPSIKWYGLKAWKKAKSWQQACLFHFIVLLSVSPLFAEWRQKKYYIKINTRSIPYQYQTCIRPISGSLPNQNQTNIRIDHHIEFLS